MSQSIMKGLVLLCLVALGTRAGKPLSRLIFGKEITKRWEGEKRYKNKTLILGWGVLFTLIGIGGSIYYRTTQMMPIVVIGIVVSLICYKQIKEMIE